MATYNIKKEKQKVIVEVILKDLPELAIDAVDAKEVVRESNVRRYLQRNGIQVYKCLQAQEICNFNGSGGVGTFIYSTAAPAPAPKPPKKRRPLKTGPKVKKVIKDLTPPPEPVIIEEKPKKRKRVKRDSKRGNETTS